MHSTAQGCAEIIDGILEYERNTGAQRAQSVSESVLRKIVEFAPKPLHHSAETGCGKTTILLSQLSDHHLCFAFDDSVWITADERGSIDFVTKCPLWRSDKTELLIGPSQRTLRNYQFNHLIDLALIDGAHAYPFPDLDYYFLYPHLRSGALLIVDDIRITTIGRMAEVLSEDEMFEPIHIEGGNTAFFRRTAAKTFDPEGDFWWEQRFNTKRFNAMKDATESTESIGRRVRRRLRVLAEERAPRFLAWYSKMKRHPR
jgi:hypothetical protein